MIRVDKDNRGFKPTIEWMRIMYHEMNNVLFGGMLGECDFEIFTNGKGSEGLFLNADINGSINILRKYFAECNEKWLFHNSVRALVNVPCQRVSPFAQAPSFRWV